MLETLYLGMTIALPPEEEYSGDPVGEGNMALRLNHLRELQSQASSHPGAVAAKKIGRLMPDITAAEERKVLKSIAEKGYYEQPLEKKQAFCRKTEATATSSSASKTKSTASCAPNTNAGGAAQSSIASIIGKAAHATYTRGMLT